MGGSVDVGIADRDQARARHPPGELYLPPEAGAEFLVCGLRRMHDLDGHPLSGSIECGVHRAHAADPELPHHAVGAYVQRIALLHRLNTAGHHSSPC
ncbi:hypothetical protein TNCT6_77710 [Streptomyces sp. 6-11-2]|nr:hypothetical protein TNCT6_77710 [Streptomyces sp. 6-11-2]